MPDPDTFKAFSYGAVTLKFIMFDIDTIRPGIYFTTSNTHRYHASCLETVDRERNEVVPGHMVYRPTLVAPDGSQGVYYLSGTGLAVPFSTVGHAYTALAAGMPLVDDNLAIHIPLHFLRLVRLPCRCTGGPI